MTVTVVLKNEAAEIVERQVSEGRYPDAESAVVAALTLLDDVALDWSEVDVPAIRQMIADADNEGGEVTREEIVQHLDAAVAATPRR